MTYNAGQFENIVSFLPREPKWLILGGPADGDEAQCAAKRWKDILILAVEPNLAAIQWQHKNDWPTRTGTLLYGALSHREGTLRLKEVPGDLRGTSEMSDRPGEWIEVPAYTIDQLDTDYGPFSDAILWLDVEGAELDSLRGAEDTLKRGKVMLVNVECLERLPDMVRDIHGLLIHHGFRLRHIWNEQPGLVCDKVYVKEGQ